MFFHRIVALRMEMFHLNLEKYYFCRRIRVLFTEINRESCENQELCP